MQILFSSTNPFAFIAYVIIGGDSNPSIYITLANLPPSKMIYVQHIYWYRKNLKLKLLTYINRIHPNKLGLNKECNRKW